MFKLKRRTKRTIDNVSMWLTAIGGVAWGLVAFGFNPVQWFASLVRFNFLANIIYVLVGLSALWLIKKSIKK